jgi:hypothetical protein
MDRGTTPGTIRTTHNKSAFWQPEGFAIVADFAGKTKKERRYRLSTLAKASRPQSRGEVSLRVLIEILGSE